MELLFVPLALHALVFFVIVLDIAFRGLEELRIEFRLGSLRLGRCRRIFGIRILCLGVFGLGILCGKRCYICFILRFDEILNGLKEHIERQGAPQNTETDEEDSDVAVSIFDSCKTYNSYANTGYQERDHEDDRENGTYFRHGACSLAE